MMFGFSTYASTPLTVSISTGVSDTICAGTPITITATPSGSATYGYIWNVNGSYAGTSSSTYTATSDTINITVDSLPVISPITAAMDSMCIGDSIQLSDITPGGVWNSLNTTAATVSAGGMVYGLSVPVGGGPGGPSVRIEYVVTNGCGSDSVRYRVYVRSPAGPISLSETTICIDSTATLTDAAGGGVWSSSNTAVGSVGFVFGAGGPPSEAVTGVAVGEVTITYVVNNICGSYTETTNVTVVDCSTTSVPSVVTLADGCNIYPNPSAGAFNVMANSSKYTHATCTISNIDGQVVKSATINTNQQTSVEMNVPTGVYFITITAGDEKYTTKMIIAQ